MKKDYTITSEGKEIFNTILRMLLDARRFYRTARMEDSIGAIIIGKRHYDLICPVLWDPNGLYRYLVDFPEEILNIKLVVVEEECIRIIPRPKFVSLYGMPSLDKK